MVVVYKNKKTLQIPYFPEVFFSTVGGKRAEKAGRSLFPSGFPSEPSAWGVHRGPSPGKGGGYFIMTSVCPIIRPSQ